MSSPHPRGRRSILRALQLEDRTTPAVGALGLVEGNAVTVLGDGTANTIIVRQVAGRLVIDGGRFVTATGPADSVAADGIDLINVVAGAGNDTVQVAGDVTATLSVSGGEGDDVLVAGGGPAELIGDDGNDQLFGGRFDDRLIGGTGNDTITGGAGNDTAFGGLGSDRFGRSVETVRDFSNAADGTLRTEPIAPPLPPATPPATPTLTGNTSPAPAVVSARLIGDILQVLGTTGDDSIKLTYSTGSYSLTDGTRISTDGGTVTSVSAKLVREVDVIGFEGNDTVDVSASRVNTRIVVAAGDDVVIGSAMNDVVFGNVGNDTITTGAGDDAVYAGPGNDSVDLGAGNDVVYGGAGDDTLTGGAGRDRVADGAGADTFTDPFEMTGDAPTPDMPMPHGGPLGGGRRR